MMRSPLPLIVMALAAIGFGLLVSKVGAQPTPPSAGPVARGAAGLMPRLAASAGGGVERAGQAVGVASSGGVAQPQAPAPPASAPAPAGSGEPKSPVEEDPVDYAEAPDGKGVPLHEGPFKSPFAHPKLNALNKGPIDVRVGILVANIREYDIQKGKFEADFFLTFTSDKPMPAMDPIFPNGKVDQKEVMADKPTFKMYRFIGSFASPPDLHDYPFDLQELVMEVEDDDNGTDQMTFRPDPEHTNLDIGFQVPGWETSFTKARVVVHNFPDRFDHDDLYYSRYEFTLGLKRHGTNAIFTVFFPAIVIVLISLTSLLFPRDELEVRANATVPMLAAAVLFHYSLTQILPATAYLTRADKLMLSVYVILGLHMVITMLWFIFHERHEHRVFRVGKLVGIPLTVLILLAGIFG